MENKTKAVRQDVLDEAAKCICQDRDVQYGPPENSFEGIAKLWSDWLDKEITSTDVAVMMTLFKIARMKHCPLKKDTFVDAVGYLACGYEVAEAEANQSKENN